MPSVYLLCKFEYLLYIVAHCLIGIIIVIDKLDIWDTYQQLRNIIFLFVYARLRWITVHHSSVVYRWDGDLELSGGIISRCAWFKNLILQISHLWLAPRYNFLHLTHKRYIVKIIFKALIWINYYLYKDYHMQKP